MQKNENDSPLETSEHEARPYVPALRGNGDLSALALEYGEADVLQQPPAVSTAVAQPVLAPSSALVLKYCELTNRHPMGTQAVSSSEGWIESTFYQVAERELQAMFAAQAALAQEGGAQ